MSNSKPTAPTGTNDQSGAEMARANHAKLANAEKDPVATVRERQQRGNAMGKKHGG